MGEVLDQKFFERYFQSNLKKLYCTLILYNLNSKMKNYKIKHNNLEFLII